jgi:hypothetical protein
VLGIPFFTRVPARGGYMSVPTVKDVMRAFAQDAVDFARKHLHFKLDYSESSIEHLESILAVFHDDLPKGPAARRRQGPSDEEIWNMAKMWGGYLGEVIRRRWKGEWTDKSAAMPDPVYTLRVRDGEIYPPSKVLKRLTDGPADNVWHFYQVLKEKWEREGSGSRK